jgi:hypothetical protein
MGHGIAVFLAAWSLVGLGMGAGFYDPAFAALGRMYGHAARPAITTLTLFGGFASTVCWPLSAFLLTHFGWRGACLSYAAFHLLMMLPLYLFGLPRESERQSAPEATPEPSDGLPVPTIEPGRAVVVMLAVVTTLSAMISTLLSVHLLTILQSRGVSLTAAVALGALVGPSQVGARTVELLLARNHHPVWTKLASAALVVVGVGGLWLATPTLSLSLMLYGGGIGLESIARGTLPLALFSPARYAAIMGMLAMPTLIAEALTPSIGAALIGAIGMEQTLAVLTAIAVVSLLIAAAIPFGLKRHSWSSELKSQ